VIEFNKHFQLTTPAGMISETGISEINQLIAAQRLDRDQWKALNPSNAAAFLPGLPFDWQWVWVVSKGVYAGTLPKRVASYYYKQFGIKSPTEFIEQLGNVARQHTTDGTAYDFDFTDEFEWEDGDFGDAGSCYWGDHAGARQMLYNDGAFAIRFYDEEGDGIGRAWVINRMTTNGFYVVFNGYGISDSATLTSARVMALFLSMTYKRIVLRNHDATSRMLWINGGVGYLIGTVEAVAETTWVELGIAELLVCYYCEDELAEQDAYTTPNGDSCCGDCYYERFDTCYECDETVDRENMIYIEGLDCDVCADCFRSFYTTCAKCGEDVHKQNTHELAGKEGRYCDDCHATIMAEQAESQTNDDPDASEDAT